MWIQTEDYLVLNTISLGASLEVVGKTGEGNPAREIFLYLVLWAVASLALTAAVF